MAATYFSSKERITDMGLGLVDVFFEHSASFFSVDREKKKFNILLILSLIFLYYIDYSHFPNIGSLRHTK